MKEIKTNIDYDKVIKGAFHNLVKATLMEFSNIKTSYKLEILVDLTNSRTKVPEKCKQDYSEDEVLIEINSIQSKIEFKKDCFTTYITNNEDGKTYKVEIPYDAVMCIVDDETGYTVDYSITDDIKELIEEIDDYDNDEYDMTALDDDKFINAIINITSKCIGGNSNDSSKKNDKQRAKKIKKIGKKENKVIYFKNLITTKDKE